MPTSRDLLKRLSEADIDAFTADPMDLKQELSVASIQRALVVRGYLQDSQIDGNFGAVSKKALGDFKANPETIGLKRQD